MRLFFTIICSALLLLNCGNKTYHCVTNVDMDNLGFIETLVKNKKIIFVGESPHGEKPIYQNMVPFIKYLHKQHKLRVVALESPYGFYPILEDMSKGKKVDVSFRNLIVEGVAEYNAKLPEEERISVTSVDVEGFIKYNKPSTVRFIKYLAGYSDSEPVKREMYAIADELPGLESRRELHSFLDKFTGCYKKHIDTFETGEKEEIEYVIPMLHASVEWLYDMELQKKDVKKWAEIRGKYYREGIKRALAKAEKRKGTLLCFVGSNHAIKTPAKGTDFPCGTWQEAEYFDREYEPTKGKIASFLFSRIYEPDTRKLFENECQEYPGKGIHYLELAKTHSDPFFYQTPDGPKYDAVFAFNLKFQLYKGPIGDAYGNRIGLWLLPKNEPDTRSMKHIIQYIRKQHEKSKFVVKQGMLQLITDINDVEKHKTAKTLIVAGSMGANPWLKGYRDKLPFKVEADKITVGDSVYNGNNLMIMACWRSPKYVAMPVIIYTGHTAQAVAQLTECESMLQNRVGAYDYVIVKDNRIVGKGMYKEWKFWKPMNKEDG